MGCSLVPFKLMPLADERSSRVARVLTFGAFAWSLLTHGHDTWVIGARGVRCARGGRQEAEGGGVDVKQNTVFGTAWREAGEHSFNPRRAGGFCTASEQRSGKSCVWHVIARVQCVGGGGV